MFTFLSFYLSDIESYKPLSNIWYCYAKHQTAIKDFFIRCLFLKIYQHSWIIIGSTPMYFHEILMDFAEKTNCSHIIQVSDHEMAKTAQDREPHLSLTPTCLWLQTLKLWDWSFFLFKSRRGGYVFVVYPQIFEYWYILKTRNMLCYILGQLLLVLINNATGLHLDFNVI